MSNKIKIKEYIVKLVTDYNYLPFAYYVDIKKYLEDKDSPIKRCDDIECIKVYAVDLLSSNAEGATTDRQVIYTLAQDKVIGELFSYKLAIGDTRVLKGTVLDGYEFLKNESTPERQKEWHTSKYNNAVKTYGRLLFLNFAYSPVYKLREKEFEQYKKATEPKILIASIQTRLLLAFLPLEPLKPTSINKEIAKAIVDFSFSLRQKVIEAYLKKGLKNPISVVLYLSGYVDNEAKRLAEIIPLAPAVVKEYLYDEAIYAPYYLYHYGLIRLSDPLYTYRLYWTIK
jgi:hypothetical protein